MVFGGKYRTIIMSILPLIAHRQSPLCCAHVPVSVTCCECGVYTHLLNVVRQLKRNFYRLTLNKRNGKYKERRIWKEETRTELYTLLLLLLLLLSISLSLLPFHFTLRFQIIFIMSAHLDAAPDKTS